MRRLALVLGFGIFAIAPGYAQDVASGEKIFVQCKACHQIGENAKNAVGPVLNGLFGRKSGTIEGYSYSPANKNSGITWDEATFREYIKDPKAKIPGTKMVFPGLKDPKQIDDIVAFLKQFDSAGKKAGLSLPEESSRRFSSGAVDETGSAAFRRLPDRSVLQPMAFLSID
ncbi:cytochrome c family protein [Bradyrhizobium lablabi]|nr:cytochrome c family protein [Bradyrhizobium lablabi]